MPDSVVVIFAVTPCTKPARFQVWKYLPNDFTKTGGIDCFHRRLSTIVHVVCIQSTSWQAHTLGDLIMVTQPIHGRG